MHGSNKRIPDNFELWNIAEDRISLICFSFNESLFLYQLLYAMWTCAIFEVQLIFMQSQSLEVLWTCKLIRSMNLQHKISFKKIYMKRLLLHVLLIAVWVQSNYMLLVVIFLNTFLILIRIYIHTQSLFNSLLFGILWRKHVSHGFIFITQFIVRRRKAVCIVSSYKQYNPLKANTDVVVQCSVAHSRSK